MNAEAQVQILIDEFGLNAYVDGDGVGDIATEEAGGSISNGSSIAYHTILCGDRALIGIGVKPSASTTISYWRVRLTAASGEILETSIFGNSAATSPAVGSVPVEHGTIASYTPQHTVVMAPVMVQGNSYLQDVFQVSKPGVIGDFINVEGNTYIYIDTYIVVKIDE